MYTIMYSCVVYLSGHNFLSEYEEVHKRYARSKIDMCFMHIYINSSSRSALTLHSV